MLSVVPATSAPSLEVGVVFDRDWEGCDEMRRLLHHEIVTLLAGDFEVSFPKDADRVADGTLAGATREVDALLASESVDAVIAAGPIASQAVCCRESLPKPVIAAFVIDPTLQGFPRDGVGSGMTNLNYIAMPNHFSLGLKAFQRMLPFQRVVVLFNKWILDAIPELPLRSDSSVGELGLQADYVAVGDDIERALAEIPPQAEAVYLVPLMHLEPDKFERLSSWLKERQLPSFAALELGEVERGILAGLRQEDLFTRIARRIALNLHRTMLGEDAGTIPVDFPVRDRVVVNMATLRATDVPMRWEVFVEAELLEIDRPPVMQLTLAGAVAEAIRVNLDLRARALEVEAAAQGVAKARANLLPQISTSLLGLQIDEDRAAASFGSQAERSLSAALSAEQLIYSDGARAGLQIERHLQRSREAELEQLRLDLAQEAAATYLNLLRAKSLLTIQRENIELTREHLGLAEVRRSIGVVGPSEVYRWESQLARDQRALIAADVAVEIAEIAMNRLLRQRQEQNFGLAEVSLTDPDFMPGQHRFQPYIAVGRYEIFRNFMVEQALRNAPELQQIDAALAAQERAATAARRAFWAPRVGLQAALEEVLAESGAGQEGPSFPETLPLDLPEADDSTWSFGIKVSLPLFTGGSRGAERVAAELELTRLRALRSSVAHKIEQRVRTSLHDIRASYTAIELTRRSAEAAQKNLELVEDSYASGVVSILELLDAQNAALVARELAASSVYDFYIDLMEVERAANRFDFFLAGEEREKWFDELDAYFEARRSER